MNNTLKGTAAIVTTLMIATGLFAGIASANSDKSNKEDKRPAVASEIKKPSNAVSVRIGENGKASVKNAAVTGISGTTVYAASSWGAVSVSWAVQTDASTKLRARGEGLMRLADIKVGDILDFDGSLTGGTGPLAVKASAITNLSAERPVAKTTFEGTLKSVASTTLPTAITVTIGGTDRTVNVALDTSILNRLWAKIALARLTIGDTIRIYGAMNASSSIDATVVRDTNIWF